MSEVEKVEINQLLNIVNEVLKESTVSDKDIDKNLMAYGMDSIKFIHMIVDIEKYYGCEIPESKLLLEEMNTIEKIMNVLMSVIQ